MLGFGAAGSKAIAIVKQSVNPPIARSDRWQMIKDNHVKGPWSPEEDSLLKVLVEEYGSKKW